MKPALDLFEAIPDTNEKAQAFNQQLAGSLNIEQIWPDAFSTGHPVRLKGKKARLPRTKNSYGFTVAYFECRDGRKYYLSRDELMAFIPDAVIHPDY